MASACNLLRKFDQESVFPYSEKRWDQISFIEYRRRLGLSRFPVSNKHGFTFIRSSMSTEKKAHSQESA
jgi:hypothetical protein